MGIFICARYEEKNEDTKGIVRIKQSYGKKKEKKRT
jgi:hypothetical protein